MKFPETIVSCVKPETSKAHPFRVVLHPSNNVTEGNWATHLETMIPLKEDGEVYAYNGSEGFFNGHYFEKYDQALNSYLGQCVSYDLDSNIECFKSEGGSDL